MNDRSLLLDAFLAGIAAVDPEASTATAAEDLGLGESGRLLVIAAGKGALAMARGIARVAEVDAGIAVSPEPGRCPIPVIVAGHPVPTAGSVAGADRALALATSAGSDDTVVCLISGGASSLLAAPADGLTLGDLQTTNRVLLRCGADITETNTVRKHLSRIKGGRLAVAAGRSRLVTLVVSDVVRDPLDVIASGPTVPDPSTYADALSVVDGYGLRGELPEPVVDHLERGRAGDEAETPKEGHPRHEIRIVGSGRVAAAAAAAHVVSRGIPARVVDTPLTGPAGEAALAAVAHPADDDEVLIFTGETTVIVTGSGLGGRNQEAALTAATAIEGKAVTFLAGGTDGIDGPTDAAGGLVDGGTIDRGRRAGLDAAALLANNDAYHYLAATGDLVEIGATGTNVADLWLVKRRIVEPSGLWAIACEI